MRRIRLILLILFAVPATSMPADTPETVSLVRLLAQPERYDERLVRVIGYARADFEGTGLFLTREHQEAGIRPDGIYLSVAGSPVLDGRTPDAFWKDLAFRQEKSRNNYLVVEGRFDAGDGGPEGDWAGTLRAIREIDSY